MACKAIPYEGNEPYIFASFSNEDEEAAASLLECMAKDGYRVWYGRGEENRKNAACRNGCSLCMVMLSPHFTASHRCRCEMNEAVAGGKKLLAVTLEKHPVTPAMALQLGEPYCLKTLEPGEGLLEMLYETEVAALCRGEQGSCDPAEPEEQWEEEGTVRDDDDATVYQRDEETIIEPDSPRERILLGLSQRKAWRLQSTRTSIGRSERQCDVVIAGNPAISSRHAELIENGNGCWLMDTGSTNGTFVGDVRLTPFEKKKLDDPGVFRLQDELFAHISALAPELRSESGVGFLLDREAMAVHIFFEDHTVLGRSDIRQEDKRISREHAEIIRRGREFWLKDMSRNGTWVNDRRLHRDEAQQLRDGDRIRMGGVTMEFGYAVFV